MPENIVLVGSVVDIDGRELKVYADHGAVRVDQGDQRYLLPRLEAIRLIAQLSDAREIAFTQEHGHE